MSHFSKKFSRFCHFPVAFQNRLSDIAPVAASRTAHGSAYYPGPMDLSGCSSGVEHNLAKVGVEGSNPFARSKFPSHRFYIEICDLCFAQAGQLILFRVQGCHGFRSASRYEIAGACGTYGKNERFSHEAPNLSSPLNCPPRAGIFLRWGRQRKNATCPGTALT
ncbi:hypothetical protein AGR13a_Lc90098 [Agrobacterium genomosp. 13 str. CFBP 6927]|uniref:Uncharacterized protein n=1 Tax=Agrobacterium genomosp. 13 str. CFBP 6927 TaxID=1183428 RepID=A0ABM9VMW8_9HYPH|nr:hypothetical protein AGR13a_Lc90098 [Agrobacterium genomosp. 13 str. CFBP 6927]